jgi:hypothetical protein
MFGVFLYFTRLQHSLISLLDSETVGLKHETTIDNVIYQASNELDVVMLICNTCTQKEAEAGSQVQSQSKRPCPKKPMAKNVLPSTTHKPGIQ